MISILTIRMYVLLLDVEHRIAYTNNSRTGHERLSKNTCLLF